MFESKSPYRVAGNPHSPLTVADLVFVDPVGTGYSRSMGRRENDKDGADKNSPLSPSNAEANAGFWNAERDLESLAVFIRTWLTENNR